MWMVFFLAISLSRILEKFTLSETNIALENRALEKEIPIGNHSFEGLLYASFREFHPILTITVLPLENWYLANDPFLF